MDDVSVINEGVAEEGEDQVASNGRNHAEATSLGGHGGNDDCADDRPDSWTNPLALSRALTLASPQSALVKLAPIGPAPKVLAASRGTHEVGPGKHVPFDRGKRK